MNKEPWFKLKGCGFITSARINDENKIEIQQFSAHMKNKVGRVRITLEELEDIFKYFKTNK